MNKIQLSKKFWLKQEHPLRYFEDVDFCRETSCTAEMFEKKVSDKWRAFMKEYFEDESKPTIWKTITDKILNKTKLELIERKIKLITLSFLFFLINKTSTLINNIILISGYILQFF